LVGLLKLAPPERTQRIALRQGEDRVERKGPHVGSSTQRSQTGTYRCLVINIVQKIGERRRLKSEFVVEGACWGVRFADLEEYGVYIRLASHVEEGAKQTCACAKPAGRKIYHDSL